MGTVYSNSDSFSLSVCLFLRLLFIYLHIAAFFIDAEKLAALLHHQSAAFWAGFRRRLLPGHEITFRIILAAVIFSSLLRFPDHQLFSALRTGYADFLQVRLRVSALRKAWAG